MQQIVNAVKYLVRKKNGVRNCCVRDLSSCCSTVENAITYKCLSTN